MSFFERALFLIPQLCLADVTLTLLVVLALLVDSARRRSARGFWRLGFLIRWLRPGRPAEYVVREPHKES